MEATVAATLQKKKFNKGKLKKTIKNVLCRPDPVFWPSVTDEQKQRVEEVLSEYKLNIPQFTKPLWKDLKSIPKEKRPKPPKREIVKGFLFGISECSNAIQIGECSAVLIESAVNPRAIVQPVLELCAKNRIPVLCVDGLRKTVAIYFGIPTSCLGVKKDSLHKISDTIFELGANKLPELIDAELASNKVEGVQMNESLNKVTPMDTQEVENFKYLYRTNKKSRVFVPPSREEIKTETKMFTGQDFIEFSNKSTKNNKQHFKKMIVKRISNNPHRVKKVK